MLRDLHAGTTIQILNRKEFSISTAEIVQITAPTPQFNMQVTPNGVMPPRQVLSMRLKWNGRDVVFNNLFADVSSAECTDNSGIVVCENENSLMNELKSTKANFDYLLNNREFFEKGSSWCDEQLALRDPVKKAEAENAKQVEAIKKEFSGIIESQNNKIDQLTALLQQALYKKKGKE